MVVLRLRLVVEEVVEVEEEVVEEETSFRHTKKNE